MKQNIDGMMVDKKAEPWRNVYTQPPTTGGTVRALSRDGIDLGKLTWTPKCYEYVDGWLPLNPIPDDIRAMQLARYTKPGSGNQLPKE